MAKIWTRNTLPNSTADNPHPYYNSRNQGMRVGISSCIAGHFWRDYWNNYHLDVLQNCVGCAIGAFNETAVINSGAAWKNWPYEIHGNGNEIVQNAAALGIPTLPKTSRPPIGGMISWEDIHVAYIVAVEYGNADGSPSPNDIIITMESGYQSSAISYDPISKDVIGSENYKTYTESKASNWGWRRDRRQRGSDSNWGYNNSPCLGFVVNPAIGTGVFKKEDIDHSDSFNPDPEPELKAPQLTSITQNGDNITIKGKMNATSGYTTKVDLYINWDSTSVSESNYDIIQSTTIENFNITISKPKEVGNVAIIAIQRNNNGKNLSSSILTKTLIRSIPCIHISIDNTMQQGIPYIYYEGKWQQGIPYIYHNSKWVAIYNDEV